MELSLQSSSVFNNWLLLRKMLASSKMYLFCEEARSVFQGESQPQHLYSVQHLTTLIYKIKRQFLKGPVSTLIPKLSPVSLAWRSSPMEAWGSEIMLERLTSQISGKKSTCLLADSCNPPSVMSLTVTREVSLGIFQLKSPNRPQG